MAPTRTPAVVLRGYDFGDTSRILRFYTRDRGLLSVVARGVRGRSGKGATNVVSFASGELSAWVKEHRDLHTMQDFHCSRFREGIGADVLRFAGASAAAELVLAHADQESHPALFETLEASLDSLEAASHALASTAALSAIWRITEAFGFAPQLDECVACGRGLQQEDVGRFDFGAGGMRCEDCGGEEAAGPRVGPIAREQIAGLLAGRVDQPVTYPRRHLSLLADFVAYHVVSRPLKSFHFLGSLMPADEASDA